MGESKLSEAQTRILYEAKEGCVFGYMQRRRMCERLERAGLLRRFSLNGYEITEAGRRALAPPPNNPDQ